MQKKYEKTIIMGNYGKKRRKEKNFFIAKRLKR